MSQDSVQPEAATVHSQSPAATNWKEKFEELLKAKNIDELKSELGKLAGDLQKEIRSFDLQDHLSPTAKEKVKALEKSYADVLKQLHRVQKQFDREFNKTLRLVKKTRTDAEKTIETFKKKFGQKTAKIKKVVKSTAKKAKKKTQRKAPGAKRS